MELFWDTAEFIQSSFFKKIFQIKHFPTTIVIKNKINFLQHHIWASQPGYPTYSFMESQPCLPCCRKLVLPPQNLNTTLWEVERKSAKLIMPKNDISKAFTILFSSVAVKWINSRNGKMMVCICRKRSQNTPLDFPPC